MSVVSDDKAAQGRNLILDSLSFIKTISHIRLIEINSHLALHLARCRTTVFLRIVEARNHGMLIVAIIRSVLRVERGQRDVAECIFVS